MNLARAQNSAGLAGVITLAVAAFALTSESLWIDEANSALKAMQPSLASWWAVLASEKGSDLQMPFYMFYLWAWEKIAGHSEVALRAANIPWFLIGQLALFGAARRNGDNPWPLFALASTQPFLWFYLNEARPYLMQYAAACVLCALLFRAAHDRAAALRPGSLWIFVGGLLMLCGSSLLGVIWAAGAGLAWLWLVRDQLSMLRRKESMGPLVIGVLSLAIMGAYYLWTLRVGGRASDIGRTGILNFFFVFYELLGLAGLGPGRLQLRDQGIAAFHDHGFSLALLVVAALLVGSLGAWSLNRAWKRRTSRAVIAGLLYAIPSVLLLFALAYVQHFRILGRHFMPLLPVLLGLFALGFSGMRARRLRSFFWITLAVVWLGSSLSVRFALRHRKDDYRGAAALAKNALDHGKSVWWSADTAAARYYQLPFSPNESSGARLVIAPSTGDLAAASLPDLVVASKPDIYDPGALLVAYLTTHNFAPTQALPAFRIWTRPDSVPR